MKVPSISDEMIISDDAELAAIACCLLSENDTYLTVLDGPRMARDDWASEVTRRNNVAARIKAKRVIFAGLPVESSEAFDKNFSRDIVVNVNSSSDVSSQLSKSKVLHLKKLKWGKSNIGVGLLKALRERSLLEFCEGTHTEDSISSKSGHLVICEEGEPISQVIAANYAFSLSAGLKIIPEVSEGTSQRLLESFYSLYEQGDATNSPTDTLADLQREIRALCGNVYLSDINSVTFISKNVPLSFGFPELPATNLFSYPDLGLAVANGLIAEQPRTRGTNSTLLIDPAQVDAPEMRTVAKKMSARRGFVREHFSNAANVRSASDAIELFPYDILVFATHCGDASGCRRTYEYCDSEENKRRLVVDVALGFGADTKDIIEVRQYIRFHELDGVDWNDPNKGKILKVGTAINDFSNFLQNDDEFKPVKEEKLDRVLGSAALKMFDNNYLFMSSSVACNRTPIVINNACGSWHSLAKRFIFAGSRGYLGTLFPVTGSEAHAILDSLFDKQWGKTLPHALWSAQNSVYKNNSLRRPYIFTGVYCSKLRVTHEDVPSFIIRTLKTQASRISKYQSQSDIVAGDSIKKKYDQGLIYIESEIIRLTKKYSSF